VTLRLWLHRRRKKSGAGARCVVEAVAGAIDAMRWESLEAKVYDIIKMKKRR
jgi:hypothetical protein